VSTVTWTGLDELKQQLRELPKNLHGEASHICEAEANAAAATIKAGYPVKTGDLRDKLTVERVDAGPFSTGFVVKNTSKLAYIFENGTQARHTAKGWNRGRMPPGRVFIPTVARRRRTMYQNLKAMLERYGLTVTGDV
jgi:hypothetical protein